MILTTKQKIILSHLISGNDECKGVVKNWMSVSELIEILPYDTSRESMYFSIKALLKKNLVEKGERILRDGRWHVPLIPTKEAIELVPQLQKSTYSINSHELGDVIFEGF